MMPLGDVAPEIALVIGAITALLAAAFLPQRRQGWVAALAATATVVAMALTAAQLGQTPRLSFSGSWWVDVPASGAGLIILGVTLAVVALAPRWFETDRRHGEFYAILLLSAAGAVLLAGAADLLLLAVAVLLSSITGYTLAAWHRNWAVSLEAGMKYFLLGALTNAVLMIGIVLVFGLLGSTRYVDLASGLPLKGGSPLLAVGLALTVAGLSFKLAAVPAHAWLPDVAEGAPAPSAAFLTIAPKVGAAVALARLTALFAPEVGSIRVLVAILAVATMTLANLAALKQDDVRRLIGWSSVSQSGYALLAVTVAGLSSDAMPALVFFLLGYALANLAAFSVVAHLRGRTALADYAGLGRVTPGMSLALALAFLSLVGIPPLGGFVGKLLLFKVAIDDGYTWLAVVAVLNSVLSLYYYLRVLSPVYFINPRSPVSVLSQLTVGAAVAAAGGLVVLGLAAGPVLRLLGL